MTQESLAPNQVVSASSRIIPVEFFGGCGRIIKRKLSDKDIQNPERGKFDNPVVTDRCGDSMKDRMLGYYIACVECAGHLEEE